MTSNASVALDMLNHGSATLDNISSALLAKDKFIAQAMFINSCVYWDTRFPNKHLTNVNYLIKAMTYKVDTNVFKKLPKSLRYDERVVRKYFQYNYLDAVKYYFPDEDTTEIYPEGEKKGTKILLYRFLSNQEDAFFDFLYRYNFSYRMLAERRIWCHTLRIRRDKAGLDVVFARLLIENLRRIQESLVQSILSNKQEDKELLYTLNESIRERRHGRVWRVTGRLFGIKWTLRV